jgi:outer membrane lipoprotein-sorting protein
MSANSAWDRAAALPVPAGERPMPEVAAIRGDLPSVETLFTFMRDAELRFATLRMTIEERAWTALGEELTVIEVALRHPGEAKVLASVPARGTAANYEVWLSDGKTVRTFVAGRKVGTRRPVRRTVKGVGGSGGDLPGTAKVYTAVTPLQAESLPELFVHPAGFCQNVLTTGDCRITGTMEVAGREAIVIECDHPRTVERVADRPDYRLVIAVDRADGVILRLEESMGDQVTRDAAVTSYEPNAVLPPSAFAFSFPADTTFIY